jgi:N-acetylneuraminic acid mutarotase
LDASGNEVDSLTTAIQGIAGSVSGTIEGELAIDTTTAGAYTIRVYVTDARDFQSNMLESPFRINDFPWVAWRPMPSPRRDFATVSVDGRVAVIGGGDVMAGSTPAPAVTTVDVYDPSTDNWTTSPPMPIAVTDHAAAVVAGKIYVIGGRSDLIPMVDTVQEYDPATQLWTLQHAMPTARSSAAAAVLDGNIYVIGGSSGGFDLVTVEVYDPATDTWATAPAMSEPRRDLAAVAIGGRILALGGYTGTHIPDGGYRRDVDAFDPDTGTWTPVADMPVARADCAVAVLDGMLYVAGGGNVARGLDDIVMYDPVADVWSVKTSMPGALAWPRAEAVNGRLYVFDTYVTYAYTPADDLL